MEKVLVIIFFIFKSIQKYVIFTIIVSIFSEFKNLIRDANIPCPDNSITRTIKTIRSIFFTLSLKNLFI